MNNRQNGRRGRGRGGNGGNGGMRPMGGGQDRGNRIDNRARGNANQLHEKYKTLARDAQMQGDRVMTEYYLQFADHYFRVLAETRGRFEDQRPQQRRDYQDDYDGEMDGDGDEMIAEPAQQRDPRRERDYRQPDNRGQQDDRGGERRANGHYNGADGGDGGASDAREPRYPRRDWQDRPPVREPAQAETDAGAPSQPEEAAEQPRRPRGRPRRERQPEAVEAGGDRLTPPSFFGDVVAPPPAPPVAAEVASEEAPAPRRRIRRPRPDALTNEV